MKKIKVFLLLIGLISIVLFSSNFKPKVVKNVNKEREMLKFDFKECQRVEDLARSYEEVYPH
jgi:hypothetical protein